MVSTRHHPREFPEPDLSPSKQTPSRSRASARTHWAHTPSNLVLIWLVISLPLVAWDVGYVIGRPHTMPGGSLQWPLYKPYELYGQVDYVYGWKAWDEKDGFTATQSYLNIVESIFYIYYLYLVFAYGKKSTSKGRGAPSPSSVGWLGQSRVLEGSVAGVACLVGFSGAVLTVGKTVLYFTQEVLGGCSNVGHNDMTRLIFLWAVPNGFWLVLPTYIIYVLGVEILQGLAIAAGVATPGSDGIPLLKFE